MIDRFYVEYGFFEYRHIRHLPGILEGEILNTFVTLQIKHSIQKADKNLLITFIAKRHK